MWFSPISFLYLLILKTWFCRWTFHTVGIWRNVAGSSTSMLFGSLEDWRLWAGFGSTLVVSGLRLEAPVSRSERLGWTSILIYSVCWSWSPNDTDYHPYRHLDHEHRFQIEITAWNLPAEFVYSLVLSSLLVEILCHCGGWALSCEHCFSFDRETFQLPGIHWIYLGPSLRKNRILYSLQPLKHQIRFLRRDGPK